MNSVRPNQRVDMSIIEEAARAAGLDPALLLKVLDIEARDDPAPRRLAALRAALEEDGTPSKE